MASKQEMTEIVSIVTHVMKERNQRDVIAKRGQRARLQRKGAGKASLEVTFELGLG